MVDDSATSSGEPSKWIEGISIIDSEGRERGKGDPWNISYSFFQEHFEPVN